MNAYEEAARRVEKGAALLDEHVPGWWTTIDVGKLDLADSCKCVLGQLFPALDARLSYSRGQHALHLSYGSSAGHGFNVSPDNSAEGEPKYAHLDEAWLTVIKQRHADGAP